MWERIKKALVPKKTGREHNYLYYRGTTWITALMRRLSATQKAVTFACCNVQITSPLLAGKGFQFAARKCYSLKSCCTAPTNAALSENGILSYFSPSLHFMAIFYHLFLRLSSTLNKVFYLTHLLTSADPLLLRQSFTAYCTLQKSLFT